MLCRSCKTPLLLFFITIQVSLQVSRSNSFSLSSLQRRRGVANTPSTAAVPLVAQRLSKDAELRHSNESLGRNSLIHKTQRFVSKNFFLCGMVVAISAARAFPALGKNGGILRPELFIGKYGVTLVFLLSGLSLELSQLTRAVANWRLNLFVNVAIFGAWPLLLGVPVANVIPSQLRDGVLILSSLPTTVNMCVILTSAAGGNVAAALCNAVFSNLLGIFATPVLLYRLMGKSAISLPFRQMLMKLSNKVLLPVVSGQLLRQTPLRKISKAKALKRLQEIILLSILWNAFCTAFSASNIGLDLRNVLFLLGLLPAMHLSAFAVMFFAASRLGFSRGDVVAAAFCASQKTLAFGLPLIHTLFGSSSGAAKLAAYSAPIMLVHPLQLILGSLLLPWLQRYTEESETQGQQ